MNKDQVKGTLQKAGGHLEEAAGALVGDAALKSAGQEDQIKGDAREAWGNLKEAGDGLIDRARVAKADAEIKAARAEAWDREHQVVVELPPDPKPPEINASAEKPEDERSSDGEQGEKKSVA